MYSNLIKKMINNFSELGCIMFSKACDYSQINKISKDDVLMYYNLLNSKEKIIPEKISLNNHVACCLYYLAKDNPEYKEKFINKFLKTLSLDNLIIDLEHLILIYNIIEFDKTYLNSPKEHIEFQYNLLRSFANFALNLENFLLYKYFRGFLKFRIGDYQNTLREYLEIIAEIPEQKNFFLKYIKLRNDLLRIHLYHTSKKLEKSEIIEYCQFLRDLYDEVKIVNKSLALKLGFDLFSAYFKGKRFNNCIPLLKEMKKILKKELLKGTSMQNGIDYYLGISSRLGYIGVLLDDKTAINSGIKKIRKTLNIIKDDKKSQKLIQLTKAYNFVLAILEVCLDKKTDFDLQSLAIQFKNSFLPDLENRSPINYFANEENREYIVIDFHVVDNQNEETTKHFNYILLKCLNEYTKNNFIDSLFLSFVLSIYSKISSYSKSYSTDKNEEKKKIDKAKIIRYTEQLNNIIGKIINNKEYDEPLLYTKYVKELLILALSSYAQVFINEKDFSQLRVAIQTINDMQKNLNIEKDSPCMGYINKIKGDYWFFNKDSKDINAAISYYENALDLFKENSVKSSSILYNIGYAYFLKNNKAKAIEYLNRSINEYNKVILEKNIFGYLPDIENINNKIYSLKKLIQLLSKN